MGKYTSWTGSRGGRGLWFVDRKAADISDFSEPMAESMWAVCERCGSLASTWVLAKRGLSLTINSEGVDRGVVFRKTDAGRAGGIQVG